MNEEKIVEELNRYVKQLNAGFKVVREPADYGDLVLYAGSDWICWFSKFDIYDFHINIIARSIDVDWQEIIAKTGVVNKFYTKAVEFLSPKGNPESKYTVRITSDLNNYLHANSLTGYEDILFDSLMKSSVWTNKFTQKEIQTFKDRTDLAIDWDKAIIEEVSE